MSLEGRKLSIGNLITLNEEGSLQQLFRIHSSPKYMEKKSWIVPSGTATQQLYMIAKGSLRVAVNSAQSEAKIHLGYLSEGDVFGEQGLFGSFSANLASASYHAKGPVELRCVSHEAVRRAAKGRPHLYSELAAHLNKRLTATTNKLTQLLFSDLETRCYECLLEVSVLPDAMSHPDGTQVCLSRIELAHMANCSRETAGRVIKVLVEKGMITVKGQRIVLVGVRGGKRVSISETIASEGQLCSSHLSIVSRA